MPTALPSEIRELALLPAEQLKSSKDEVIHNVDVSTLDKRKEILPSQQELLHYIYGDDNVNLGHSYSNNNSFTVHIHFDCICYYNFHHICIFKLDCHTNCESNQPSAN